jgi:hypothetical protein
LTEADGIQEKHKGYEYAVFELYKTSVRQLPGEFVFQVNADVVQVKVLEIAERTEVVEHQDGHNSLSDISHGRLRCFFPSLGKRDIFAVSFENSLQESSVTQKISVILSVVSRLII